MDRFDQVLDLFNCNFVKDRGKTVVRQNRAFNKAWTLTELYMLQDLLSKREWVPNRAPEDEHTPMTRDEIEATLEELVAHGSVTFDGFAYKLAGWTDPNGYKPESWKNRHGNEEEATGFPERISNFRLALSFRVIPGTYRR